ncbi:MAG: hypothetical protein K2M54_01475 [Muribaculaceae bacterium]|nr:hypothetical protein [Muribaculaceae bacterium]
MDNNSCEKHPVMLYLQVDRNEMTDSVGAALQKHFGGTYRVIIIDTDKSLTAVNEIMARENPQIVVAHGIAGNFVIRCDRDEDTDIIVVNPTIGEELYDIPMWKFNNLFALCSINCGESYFQTIRSDFSEIHVAETKDFGQDLNQTGISQLIALLKKIIRYRELGNKLMSYQEFEKMVRNRPKPDMPSYYRLKVYSYDTNEGYSREIVDDVPTYRRSVSLRQAQFATKTEAIAAMQDIVASAKEDICMFELERLPFGVFDSKPFWVEAWSYDSRGNLIQEASCSGSHYLKAGIYGKFFGHLPEKIKWRDGDIVQLFHHYFGDSKTYVCLGVVAEQPKDTHEGYDKYIYAVKQWIKDGNNPKDWLEMTGYEGSDDDEMFTQFGPYNDDWSNFTFNNPMAVLPAPENLPEEIKAELHSWHADWLRHLEEERAEEIRVINRMCGYEN